MKLRLYQNRQATQLQDDDRKRHRRPDNPSATVPENIIEASQHTAARGLRQQALLQMQQAHGNKFVQRYLKDLGILPAQSIHRRTSPSQGGDPIPSQVYVATIRGQKQGVFKGKSRIAGHDGMIQGNQLSFTVRAGDSTSQKSGPAPETKPQITVTLVKEMDDSIVQFLTALTNDEVIKTARFELLHHDEAGELKIMGTFQFNDGKVTQVETISPNSRDATNEKVAEYSRISMVFHTMSK